MRAPREFIADKTRAHPGQPRQHQGRAPVPVAEQHRAEQRHGDTDHGGHIAHQRRDQGDEGGGDGKVQAQVLQARNALAQDDAQQGEQVPGHVEGQAHAQGVPAVELLLVVGAGQGEQLIGKEKAQAHPPTPGQGRDHRAQAHAVEQMLGREQQGGQQDREDPRPALEHADGHQLRGAGEDNARQALALQRGEIGLDGHGTGQQPQGAVARDSGMMAMAPRINAARGRRTLDITPCTQMTDADCASWHGAWLERSCAIAHRRTFLQPPNAEGASWLAMYSRTPRCPSERGVFVDHHREPARSPP